MDWTDRLRFRHLKVLLSLHHTCNLSATAHQMAMTQPALSKWLRQLEEELGMELFVRHSRGLVPTASCDVFAQRARLLLNEVGRTAELLGASADGMQGALHVGVTPSAVEVLLPEAIVLFQPAFPKASVIVTEGALGALLPRLQDGELDVIASILEEQDYGEGLARERLYRDELVVVAGCAHPLQRTRTLAWDAVLRYPWIGPPRDGPLHRQFEQQMSALGKRVPSYFTVASSSALVASIVERSDAVSVMTARNADRFERQGRLRRLRLRSTVSNSVGMLYRPATVEGVLVSGFLDALRRAGAAV